jgi:hypothetical protein
MADDEFEEHAHVVGHGVAVHCDARGSRLCEYDPATEGEEPGPGRRIFRKGGDGVFRPAKKAGPAMVNGEEFRTGWERLFGAKQAAGQA